MLMARMRRPNALWRFGTWGAKNQDGYICQQEIAYPNAAATRWGLEYAQNAAIEMGWGKLGYRLRALWRNSRNLQDSRPQFMSWRLTSKQS